MHRIQAENEIRALSAQDVARILQENGFPECEQMIIQNGIDGKILMQLTEFNLRTMKHNPGSAVLKRLWTYISKIKEDPNLLFGDQKKSTVKTMVQNMERRSSRGSKILSPSDSQESIDKLHGTLKSGSSEEELKSTHVPTPDLSSSMEQYDHVQLTNARKTSQVELVDDQSEAAQIEVAANYSEEAVFTKMDTNESVQNEANYNNDVSGEAKKNEAAQIENYSNDLKEEANRSAHGTSQIEIEDSEAEVEYDVLGRFDDKGSEDFGSVQQIKPRYAPSPKLPMNTSRCDGATCSEDVRSVQVMTPRYAPSPEIPMNPSIPIVPKKSRRREEIIPKTEDLYELNKRQITSHSCFVQFSKADSEGLLGKEQNGSYLVRPSETFGFVLVVKSEQKCYNIPLRVDKSFTLRQQGQGDEAGKDGFERFDDLIKYYTNKKIKLQGGSVKLRKQNFFA